MIKDDELLALIDQHESDQVELTESTTDTDKFSEAVCAFANDMPDHKTPGYLVVGIKDDKKFAGLTVSDRLLQTLSAFRSNGDITPLPTVLLKNLLSPQEISPS